METWKKRPTFKMIQEAGIGWVKQQFPWEEIEQPRKGEFFDRKYNQSTWDKFDEMVKLAESARAKIIARLDRPPGWAHSDKPPGEPARALRGLRRLRRGRRHALQGQAQPLPAVE